ncbi:probable leucine-rich repeat receptor-like serine/threonine-protein kinase At3g14840 isoform X2 [Malania oleifera]|uniref:probable leucine-rich repeat receptor-like serine/threonine-protein kinase At3g14840 isoform X2 n=1 Tax=Malania oleifera TaxID=397392 RepID=UPI0025AE707F|nr:probable leucine-rich repeat receptor-like serine/threonine-protein kinase At3g14840 isoform X2 [Malania oleifera]
MFASSSSSPLLVFPILIICSAAFAFVGATARTTLLPESEVKALQQIGKSLGKTDWNFSADPCGGEWGWISQRNDSFENALNCSWPSSINDTVPHVVSIVLKGQSLPGTLPKELVKLPYLQQIDLTRNYLSGTIPPEWGSLPLVNISLLGNRLTGSIPKEIGSISTLESFVVEFNQLSGVIPRELGNLSSIKRLFLTSNNFTGELPGTFAKLTTLNDFRISDNYFTGSIPNFIQNWANLSRLVIQASGLEGPIPPGISLLEKITDLRISDLNGTEELFPPLSNAKNLKILVLRSCNIIGPLPEYLVDMVELKTLDLCFNKLSGEIPHNYSRLSKLEHMYLTGNLLTGRVPWIPEKKYSMNLFKSSLDGNNSGYMAPEYAMRGYLTDKADVYSFGIVALEIVSGRSNSNSRGKEHCFQLLDWALLLKKKGDLMELVDPKLGLDFIKEEVMTMINVALLCTNASAEARPIMSSVVSMLEGRAVVQALVSESSVSNDEMKLQAMKDYYQIILEQNISGDEIPTHSMSTDGPCTDSSTSGADLYPIRLGSDYFQKRN